MHRRNYRLVKIKVFFQALLRISASLPSVGCELPPIPMPLVETAARHCKARKM